MAAKKQKTSYETMIEMIRSLHKAGKISETEAQRMEMLTHHVEVDGYSDGAKSARNGYSY